MYEQKTKTKEPLLGVRLKTRLILAVIGMVGLYSLFVYSSLTTVITESDANVMYDDLQQKFDEQGDGALPIFLNNGRISMIEMIPVYGIYYSYLSATTTGAYVAALFTIAPEFKAEFNFLTFFAEPFVAMEFASYGIAASRSGIFVHSLVTGKSIKTILLPMLIEAVVIGLLLYFAAVIEWDGIAFDQALQDSNADMQST